MKSLIILTSLVLQMNFGIAPDSCDIEKTETVSEQKMTGLSVPREEENKMKEGSQKIHEGMTKVDSTQNDYFFVTCSNVKPEMIACIN